MVRLLSNTYPHIFIVGNGFIYTSPADRKSTLGATFAPAQPENALGNIIVNVDARDEYEAAWADAGEARIPDPQDAVALLYHELVEAKHGNTQGVSSKQAHELGLKFEDQFRSEEGLPRRMTQKEFDAFNRNNRQPTEELRFSDSELESYGRELPATLPAPFTYDLPEGEAVIVQHIHVNIHGGTESVRTDVTPR